MAASLPEQLYAGGDNAFVCGQATDERWAMIFQDHAATQQEPSDQLNVFWCQPRCPPSRTHAHLGALVETQLCKWKCVARPLSAHPGRNGAGPEGTVSGRSVTAPAVARFARIL